ncbi:PREDICTED: transcription factor MEE8-like isoform X2 [Camelina sativa]|uniref:Transcription factor MEE8-like isoform X2 n=1 Tax=Camelina sativa TaxID=90675 RepID=A0ABM0WYE7_CAMSA|nr:PREDICTED: transcription factor MEE8-like isoform X2 [Camelina sativa]
MNNDEEFLRLWLERVNSLADPEAHSNVRRINNEGGEENARQKRPAESKSDGKKSRVKRQCATKSPDELLAKEMKRELIRTKLEELKAVTPNCPQTDVNAMLDCTIEYVRHLQLAILFIAFHEYVRNTKM